MEQTVRRGRMANRNCWPGIGIDAGSAPYSNGQRMRIVLLSALLCVGGCTKVIREPICLQKPERPALPAVSEPSLQCLSTDTYRNLTLRDTLRRQYAEKLELIVDAPCESR